MIINTSFTASSAIATNGTTTFGYPTRPGNAPDVTTLGDFQGSWGHQAFVESFQSLISSPGDFTLTFGNSSITFTWLGTQTIPANSKIVIDIHTIGQNAQSPYGVAFAGSPGDAASQANTPPVPLTGVSSRVQLAPLTWLNFGCPVTASATSVVNAATRADATTVATPFTLDVARTLQYVCGSAGDTTQTLTTKGLDDYGVAMTETVTLNGTSVVHGKKAFKSVISTKLSAALTTTLSVGSDVILGVPVFIPYPACSILDIKSKVAATAGTWVGGDQSTPSATTGDVRGTYSPNTAPSSNTNTYESFVVVPDFQYLGATQF